MNKQKLRPTIGLEIHGELRTNSKMFCGCPADHFGKEPNTQTCPVCLALPGALPVPNIKAIEWTILIGLALNCKINKNSKFDRKHYFYPDLPKGYQISQYDEPFCVNGYLDTTQGRVGITRVHLEEDTGKLQHSTVAGERVTLVDFNRSGVALVEIVTEPDIVSASQAKEFAQKLQQILRHLEVTDADMEKGSLRLEANISLGLDLGYKVEVKNLNSFKFVEKAIEYELERQKEIFEIGEIPLQETRGWSEAKNITISQRVKETSADYRYFPEPDIPPIELTGAFIKEIEKKLPELPEVKRKRFEEDYGLRKDYAYFLSSNVVMSRFAEEVFKLSKQKAVDINKVAGYLVNQKMDISKLDSEKIVSEVSKQKSDKIADDDQLKEWVEEAVTENQKAVEDYKKGKTNAISVIIGNVMRISRGKADASIVGKIAKEILKD